MTTETAVDLEAELLKAREREEFDRVRAELAEFQKLAINGPLELAHITDRMPAGLVVGDRSVYMHRRNLGTRLAQSVGTEADRVIAIPNAEKEAAAALGYADASGIPFGFAIVRNNYSKDPLFEFEPRAHDLRRFNVMNEEVSKKRLVVVDGTFEPEKVRAIAAMLHQAGAAEIHWRSILPSELPDPKLLSDDLTSFVALSEQTFLETVNLPGHLIVVDQGPDNGAKIAEQIPL